MLQITYDFSVDFHNLTFTYSAYKFYSGLNWFFESFRNEHLNENLDKCAGMDAVAEYLTFRGFNKSILLNYPVICNTAGIAEAYDNYFEGLLDNCIDGKEYKITQLIYISE